METTCYFSRTEIQNRIKLLQCQGNGDVCTHVHIYEYKPTLLHPCKAIYGGFLAGDIHARLVKWEDRNPR